MRALYQITIFIVAMLTFSLPYSFSHTYEEMGVLVCELSENMSKREYEDCLNALLMKLWTKIDLIRAIHLSDEQKAGKIDDLIDIAITLYVVALKGHAYKLLSNNAHKQSIARLIKDIDSALFEVFDQPYNSGLVTLSYMLEKVDHIVSM